MRSIFRILAVAYIAYIAISVLVIIPALNFIPHWYVKEALNRDLHTDIIVFNPVALSLEVRGAQLPEHNGERFASLGQATVNLSLESLWQTGWVFDEISTNGLWLHIRQLAQGGFNFSDMLPPEEETPPPEEEDAAIPGVTIHTFEFQSERIAFTDEGRDKPYTQLYEGISIEVNDLSTVLEEGRPYRIDARGEGGGILHWEGEVSIPKATASGTLALSNLSMPKMWRIAEPWLGFELVDGRFSIQAEYKLDWRDELQYHLSQGEILLSGVDIQAAAGVTLDDTSVGLQALSITGVSVDGVAQRAQVADITVDGLEIDGWMEGEQISLVDLFAVELPQGEEEADETGSADKDTEAEWTAALASVRLQNSRVGWRSEFTDPPLLEVSPLEASLQSINWPLAGDTPLALELAINGQAKLTIGGALDLGSGDGSISYQLEGLPIPWANPNLPDGLNAVLTDGALAVQGKVALAGFAPTTIESEGAISNFSGKIKDAEESLTSFETVRWQGLSVDMEQQSVVLKKLSIDDYAGRLHIRKDGSINAQNVWKEEVGEQAQELADDLSHDKPWEIDLPQIVITDSELDFMDESLPISFRTIIGDLNGEVLGISTTPGAAAQVDIRGSVDGYAPVVLAGSAEPFGTPTALDLKLTFDGVDLSLLTPYSATYAGYAIDRGLLNLDLQYALKNNHLEGHNSVMVDQLKLGEQVDSDKAVDLPLELALVLLTDANGVISLEVPVNGDVDDPSFDVGSVIAGAFMNLITKAVTAPFTLLASLVGSEEDLQRVNFATGSAELDDAGRAKLTELNSALAQRPSVKLVIAGRLNPEADRSSLQGKALRQQLLDAGLTEQQWEEKGAPWEKAINKRYQALGSPATGADSGTPATMRQKYDQVSAAIQVADSQLVQLAEDRAVAIKAYLVNEAQLAPDRAAIEQASLDDKDHIFSGVELSVGS